MNILFYTSPYQYYADNLISLVKEAESRGHIVYKKFSLKPEKDIKKISVDSGENIFKLISQRKVDVVILVQPWWYADKEIAGACNKYGIPFYIVDHAPPMMPYTEEGGKKSHLYRANLFKAKAFFAYGQATKKVMRVRGCKENIVVTGSPRIEMMLDNYKLLSKEKDRKSFVLFDTSNRMEDKSLLKEFSRLRKAYGKEWDFYVKKHSRSPGYFSKIPGVGEVDGPEEQIIYFADAVGFTFPSSAMILPALLDKDIIALYKKHFCREAQGFYKWYQESIPDRPGKKKASYENFLNDHYYLKKSPCKTIMNYIEREK